MSWKLEEESNAKERRLEMSLSNEVEYDVPVSPLMGLTLLSKLMPPESKPVSSKVVVIRSRSHGLNSVA